MKVSSLENFVVDKLHLNESTNDSLVITVAAIHEGLTRNLTYYTGDCLKESIESWVKPYNKKVLTHHNDAGEPVGIVLSAYYALDEKCGRHATFLKLKITDKDAIEKVKDGRYNTVSIGCSIDDNGARCSICGGVPYECEHYRGEIYDGKLCYWEILSMTPDEVSFVNVPADNNAIVAEIEDGQENINDGPIVSISNSSNETKLNESLNIEDFENKNIQTAENDGIISIETKNEMSKAKAEFAKLYYSLANRNK